MACENDKCDKYGLHHDYKDGIEIRKCHACQKDEEPPFNAANDMLKKARKIDRSKESDENINISPLPCPFCGWERIDVFETIQQKGKRRINSDPYSYCSCPVCGTKGPWAYSCGDDRQKVFHDCVMRWNERGARCIQNINSVNIFE